MVPLPRRSLFRQRNVISLFRTGCGL